MWWKVWRRSSGGSSSGGPIGYGEVHFEAVKIGGDEVWAIAQLQ